MEEIAPNIYNSARVKKIIQFLFSSCPYID